MGASLSSQVWSEDAQPTTGASATSHHGSDLVISDWELGGEEEGGTLLESTLPIAPSNVWLKFRNAEYETVEPLSLSSFITGGSSSVLMRRP